MEWLTNLLSVLGQQGGAGPIAAGSSAGMPASSGAIPEGLLPPPDPAELSLQEQAQAQLAGGSPYQQGKLENLIKGLGAPPPGREWAKKLSGLGEKLATQSAAGAISPQAANRAGAAGLPIPQGFGARNAGGAVPLTFNDVFQFGRPPAGEQVSPEALQQLGQPGRRGRYTFQ